MSFCAAVCDHVLMLIEPQAYVCCLGFWLPRQPLAERLVKAYAAAHLAVIEQHLARVGQGLRLKKLSRY
jgi:hypothetical protein